VKPSVVIFSDLDGTLLDSFTYSWDAARSALKLAQDMAIPLVLCSSKTRVELEVIRKELQIQDPFISENGGGIYVPEGSFHFEFQYDVKVGPNKLIELGTPYIRLRDALRTISKQTGVVLKGFGDLSISEVAAETGLTKDEAQLAKQREYDEPFMMEGGEEQKEKVLELIEKMGLHCVRGGRYYHLMGNQDKGKAVMLLTRIYRQKSQKVLTIGLGDGQNDLPMLEVVDHPILVRKHDGTYEETANLKRVIKTEGKGPQGWNEALLKLLSEITE